MNLIGPTKAAAMLVREPNMLHYYVIDVIAATRDSSALQACGAVVGFKAKAPKSSRLIGFIRPSKRKSVSWHPPAS